MISHEEMNRLIGTNIRNDTYYILWRIIDYKESYIEARKYVIDHWEELKISKRIIETQNIVTIKRIKEIIDNYNLKAYDGSDIILGEEEPKKKKSGSNKKKEKKEKEYGIYGIYIDNKLVYIGMTAKSFGERFSSYKTQIQNPSRKIEYMMVNAKQNGKMVEMRPLIVNNEFVSISEIELKKIEYSLIKILQPEGNLEGTVLPYDRTGKIIRGQVER